MKLRNGQVEAFRSIGARMPADRAERRECLACRAKTTEGKPFCADHLGELPYVASVRREIAELDASGRHDRVPSRLEVQRILGTA